LGLTAQELVPAVDLSLLSRVERPPLGAGRAPAQVHPGLLGRAVGLPGIADRRIAKSKIVESKGQRAENEV